MKILDECNRIALAQYSAHKADTFKHWAFIYQNGHLLEVGQNKLNDPVGLERYGYKDSRHSLHAEAVALRKAYGLLDRRKSWIMVNIRISALKQLTMAAPCSICRPFIRACGCTTCYFSINGGFAKTVL